MAAQILARGTSAGLILQHLQCLFKLLPVRPFHGQLLPEHAKQNGSVHLTFCNRCAQMEEDKGTQCHGGMKCGIAQQPEIFTKQAICSSAYKMRARGSVVNQSMICKQSMLCIRWSCLGLSPSNDDLCTSHSIRTGPERRLSTMSSECTT